VITIPWKTVHVAVESVFTIPWKRCHDGVEYALGSSAGDLRSNNEGKAIRASGAEPNAIKAEIKPKFKQQINAQSL
jgi:hypothetical protein